MPSTGRCRGYCFTWNNYDDASIDALQEWFDTGRVNYLVYGKELAPSSGTPHLQGYMWLKESMAMSAVHKAVSQDGFVLIPARGTAEQNYDYARKDGDFVEYGVRPKSAAIQCKLNNEHYADCIQLSKNGEVDAIMDKYPQLYIKYRSTINGIIGDYMKPPDQLDDVCGEWWYGPPGTGKSHKAFAMGCYDKEPNKWFGGYNGKDPIVIQDLDHENAKWMGYHLKKWGDRYPFTAEVKGRQFSCRPPKVIVTSNYTIRELYTDSELIKALERRYKVTHFSDIFIRNT